MKTVYKVRRGHVWHVIHETKTAMVGNGAAWTLCGSYYDAGEAGVRAPTCPGCLRIDNPLGLTGPTRQGLRVFTQSAVPFVSDQVKRELVRADYITHEGVLTRRGRILAEDFWELPVPLPCVDGLVHARLPLDTYARCLKNGRLLDVDAMTTERYAKLRMVADQVMVTCFQCITLGDQRDDLY